MIKKQKGELEFLPPRKRYECPDCKKRFTKLWKCKDGIMRCKLCKRKLITNPFYVEVKERKNMQGTIGKYNFTTQEKNQLHRQFMNEGLDSPQAWQKVYSHIQMLREQKQKNRWSDKQRKRYFAMRRKEEQSQKQRLVEGLR